jgi:hypothetical protein
LLQTHIDYMEAYVKQTAEGIEKSYATQVEKLIKDLQRERNALSHAQDQERKTKQLEIDRKKRDIDWHVQFSRNEDKYEEAEIVKNGLDLEMQNWMFDFDIRCSEQDKKLDDLEEEVDRKLDSKI